MGNRRAASSVEGAMADLIGRRWGMLIVQQLRSGPHRFNELKASLPGISSKTLSLNLKELEREQVVTRKVLGTKPLRVEYALTQKGESLNRVLDAILEWGEKLISLKAQESL